MNAVQTLVRHNFTAMMLLTLVFSCLMLWSLPDRAARGRPVDLVMIFLVQNALFGTKFPPHWLTLPVTGREMLQARLWQLFAMAATILTVGWLILLLFASALLQAGTVSLLHGLLGVLTPALLSLCILPKQATPWRWLPAALLLGGMILMSFVPSVYFVPPAAGACLLLTYYALKNAPASYLVAPATPMAVDPWWTAPRRLFATRWAGMPMVRSVCTVSLLFLPVMAMDFGGWLSALYGLAVVSTMLLKQMAWAFMLPFSRRRILLTSLSVGFVSFALGFWFHLRPILRSEVAAARSLFRREGVDRPATATPSVVVSDRYLRWAWNGAVPVVRAPWGERMQGDPSVAVGPLRLYNPYFAGPQNSHRFFEWQFARATTDVYGQAFQSTDDLRGVTPLRLTPRQLITTAGLSLSVGLLSLAFLFWVRRRATDGDQVLAWCVYLLPAFLAAMILALQALGAGLPLMFFDSYSVEVLAGALLPVLPTQPGVLAALWAGVLLVLYRLAEASFARVNAPSPERR